MEPVPDFAVVRALAEMAAGVARDDLAPEGYRTWVPLIFDHFPVARKAIENEGGRVAAHTGPAIGLADEKLRHAIIDGRLAGRAKARPRDQRKTDRIRALYDQQRVRMVVGEPIREDLFLLRTAGTQTTKNTRIEIGECIEVLAVNLLNPLSIAARPFAVTNAD